MEEQNAKELHEGREFLQEEGEVVLQEGEEQSATDRILAVITAPKRAFAGLLNVRLGGVIGVSLAVAILLSMVSTFLMFSSPEVVETMRAKQAEQLDKKLDGDDLSSAQKEQLEKQREQFEEMSQGSYVMWGVVGSVIGIPIFALIIGLLIFIIAKVIEDGRETRIKFGHALAVATLGGVVTGVGGLLSSAIIRLTGNPETQLGLSTFVQSDSSVFNGVIGLLSLPYLWWMIVVGIGIAAIARSSVAKSTLIFGGSIFVVTFLFSLLMQQIGVAFGF